MKVFPSYATNPVKQQCFFHSPKSAILPSAIGNFDDPLLIGMEFGGTTFFFCLVKRLHLEKKRREEFLNNESIAKP